MESADAVQIDAIRWDMDLASFKQGPLLAAKAPLIAVHQVWSGQGQSGLVLSSINQVLPKVYMNVLRLHLSFALQL